LIFACVFQSVQATGSIDVVFSNQGDTLDVEFNSISAKKLADNKNELVNKVFSKAGQYEHAINKDTKKLLNRLIRLENKVKKILHKVSPDMERKLFGAGQSFEEIYKQYLSKQTGENLKGKFSKSQRYIEHVKTQFGYLDSITNLYTLENNGPSLSKISKLDSLQKSINFNEYIQDEILKRRKFLLSQLSGVVSVDKVLDKMNFECMSFLKEAVKNRELLFEHSRIEKEVTKYLGRMPDYFKYQNAQSSLRDIFRNSALSFPPSASSKIIEGIPLRSTLQQNIPEGGDLVDLGMMQIPSLRKVVDNFNTEELNLNTVSDLLSDTFQLNKLKSHNEISAYQSMRQRLEFGFNVQFSKSKSILPATGDMGLNIGYKISKRFTTGLGISFKIGLGSGWNNIRLSGEGFGARSFVKYSIGKKLDLYGGWESNFVSKIKKMESILESNVPWRTSILGGISKSYIISKKLKGNIQVLFDFLYDKNRQFNQPFLIRFGYEF
jgi:hypothetical protein